MPLKQRLGWEWAPWASLVGLSLSCAATVPDSSVPVANKAGAAPPAASSRPLPTTDAPAIEPPPDVRHCQPTLDPAADSWQALEGCSVTFKSGRVVTERSCTMAMCGERPCCNRCSEGGLALLSGNDKLLLSSRKAPLTCREGLDCDAYRDCDVPPGDAEVTGVLWRRENQWYLDTLRVARRVGPCELKTAELKASELSPADACRASFSCDDGRQVSVSCDGENDGTNTSLCECQLGDRTVSLRKAIRGEAPHSCELALEPCLKASGKK